jgi:hypothetical protein
MDSALFISALVLGAGLAIDVAIATIARFRDKTLTFMSWTLQVVLLHILFISASYFLSLGITQQFPILRPTIGVIGFCLVMSLVYQVTFEALGKEPAFRLTSGFEKFGLTDHSSKRLVVLIAITLDALVSGPVIAPWIAALNSSIDLSIFFLTVGIGVGAVTQIAVLIASGLRKRKFDSAEKMARWFTQAKYIELSVIGGFGIASPWQSMWGNSNLYLSILFMAVLMGLVWIKNYKIILTTELEDAKEAIVGGA